MKTKNTRVRLKDIKQGRIIYIASGEFEYIDIYLIKSKPFLKYSDLGLFVKAHRISDNGNLSEYYDDNCPSCHKSLRDMGVLNNTYNDKKTFFKLKQAQAYIKRFAK